VKISDEKDLLKQIADGSEVIGNLVKVAAC
jgi:hypothetical protein